MIDTENLQLVDILSNLTSEELAKIQAMFTEKDYSAGETILLHGDSSSSVFFLAKGAVRSTTYSSSGKEICFQHLTQGEMFGELSAIDGLPRTTSIIAQTDCILGVMEAKQLWKLMEEYPSIMAGVLKRLSALVRFLCSRVYEYGALGTRERTRAEILRLARKHMISDRNAVITDMPTHEDIANRIASHREAVTKEFSYLTKMGLIEKKGTSIVVPDVEALSATLIESIAY